MNDQTESWIEDVKDVVIDVRPGPRTSPEIDEIVGALAIAQGQFEAIQKNRVGKVQGSSASGRAYDFEYHYADLSDVLNAIRKPLSENGIAIAQFTVAREGHLYLHTRLLHKSGQWLENEFPVASLTAAISQQKIGASLTYARRYSLCALVGVAAEEDTDSAEIPDNGGGGPQKGKGKPPRTVVQSPVTEANGRNRQPLPPRAGTKPQTHQAKPNGRPDPVVNPEGWKGYLDATMSRDSTVEAVSESWNSFRSDVDRLDDHQDKAEARSIYEGHLERVEHP